ncbi:ABC transporter substrate-binding protein [uncultured Enterovirga sp.]|uniref:ABC transporter substrate-binding protein n=1 Tax=uncultured Enterovirga sp. TaxID=2026352 RepID=UPI0035CB20DA
MRFLAFAAGLLALASVASAQAVDPALLRDIAPTGRLRAAINLGNPVLAVRSAGEPSGVSVDLARELARRLGLPLDLIPFDAAGTVTEAAGGNVWDVAFLAIDPKRADQIDFTPPYVVIEGAYAVPVASDLREVADIDREGIRIAVGRGSAYDLYLSRTIRRATLVRAPTSPESLRLFTVDKLEVAANVRQPLERFVRETPGYRMIPGRFMIIEQAMGSPRGRALASRYLAEFVEEAKASGFVAAALARHSQPDAAVAAPARPR